VIVAGVDVPDAHAAELVFRDHVRGLGDHCGDCDLCDDVDENDLLSLQYLADADCADFVEELDYHRHDCDRALLNLEF
jgi:hypothetical protein